MAGTLRRIFKGLVLSLVSMLGLAVLFAAHEWYAKPFFVNNFLNRAFIQLAWDKPEMLTYLGVLEQFGITGHNAQWDDNSLAASDRDFALAEEVKGTADRYDEDSLSETELLSLKVARETVGNPEEDRRFRFHDYPVNQLDGLQIEIPRFLDSFHQVNSAEDAEHYLSRLSGIELKMDQNMEGLLIRENRGIIPPTFVIDKSIEIMRNFIASPADENVLYTSFAAKLEGVDAMEEAEKARFLSDAKREIDAVVYPAYREYIDYFAALRGKSDNRAGVWKLPDGAAYYNYRLRKNTTTEMTAEQIHAIGLAEVERIKKEMLDIFAAEGYDPALGIKALFDALADEDRFYYPDTDEGRAQIIADYTAIIEEIEAGVAEAFNVKPKAGVVVQRVPQFSEATASGAYYSGPSQDGSRPGTFYANLFNIRATPRYSMRTLAYHEAVPGHHFQIAIQTELEGVPAFRKAIGFTAYSEGWGLYAERLAWEMGFQSDPYDNLGRLRDEMLRAVRLVVDTGIHAKRWTRERAIDYMQAHTGNVESDVIAEIERYIVLPGQATAYKVGMLELLRLRDEAQQALGDGFDIRDFHDVVLKDGPLPLTVLREQVLKYIAGAQAS